MFKAIQILLVLVGVSTFASDQVVRKVDDASFAALEKDRGLHLDVRVKGASEMDQALRFFTGTFGNHKLPKSIQRISSNRAFVPFSELSPIYRRMVIQRLWPKNGPQGDMYRHEVTYSGHETLWAISAWFTGDGKNYKAIAAASGLSASRIKKGSTVLIPLSLMDQALIRADWQDEQPNIDPAMADHTPIHDTQVIRADDAPATTHRVDPQLKPKTPPPQLEPSPELAALRSMLTYGSDQYGKYAAYRLRRGEAIYSSVVVRFCGLVSGEDVNRVAGDIIKRNGIRDETDLPIGHVIRIPYDLLEPEYREQDDPEYLAYMQNLLEVSQVATKVVSRNLNGVYVILDAGHGGRDTGAKFSHVWEDDYVYDILCRVKERLERETQAVIIATSLDPSVSYRSQDVSKFRLDQDEVLNTNPPFPLNHSRVTTDGVNLRWMLANHQYDKLIKRGVKPENMVFASFHADSLHPSLRGAMVYIPDARYYPTRVGPPNRRLSGYAEYKGNQFSFDKATMQDAQARSMAFAEAFVQQARLSDIQVHRSKPIRSVIRRQAHSRPFVPAVLRFNRVPTRCLVEVCNLANGKDRELMTKPEFRQSVADAFVAALYRTYGLEVSQVVSASNVSHVARTPE
ncbi:MAG: N-acetylmuramoyl-L-alanine amidase [Acidobacteria bacterium]|nr:N-acetylmuramoyl-L-alanine amidase [Acidobacteriota bacterium]